MFLYLLIWSVERFTLDHLDPHAFLLFHKHANLAHGGRPNKRTKEHAPTDWARMKALGSKIDLRRVQSTPDPTLSLKFHDAPPTFIAIFLQKYALPLAESRKNKTPPICIAIRLPIVSRYFCRSIRVRDRWNTPKNRPRIGFRMS